MNILLKVFLIIFSSTILMLMLFDYDAGRKELTLPSKINCVTLPNNQQKFVCNTCFKVNSKDKPQEILQIQSTHPFMLLSLKQQISGIFTCQEWLQAVDYETVKNQNNKQQSLLRYEPSVNKFLKTLQNQHNQILLNQKSQLQSESQRIHQITSSLDRPYQVISFYSKTKQPQFLKIYQSNQETLSTGTHILTLLIVSISFATLYVFHCVEKNTFKKYGQHAFCIIGIFGSFLWVILGNLIESYGQYITFNKILYFSTAFDIFFGAGRWLFFGIIFITEFFADSVKSDSSFYTIVLNVIFLAIMALIVGLKSQRQYFHLQKNSNKKIFFLFMTFLILSCTIGEHIWKENIFSQICQFLIGYFTIVSFVFGIKNLDGNDYQKILKEQTKNNKNQSTPVLETTSTTMYEQNDQIQDLELQKKIRK